MKTLVVYYTKSGWTEKIAQEIGKLTKGELRKIVEIKSRNGILGFIRSGFEAVRGALSELRPMDFNLSNYDQVFLGTPVWAGSPTPAVNSFIAEADFKGKKVVLFLIMGGERYERPLSLLKEKIRAKGGKVAGSFAISSSRLSEEQLKEEVKRNLKIEGEI
jgi:flavodoxin